MHVVLSTLPREGEYKSWATSSMADRDEVKYLPLGLLSLATNVCSIVQPTIMDPASFGWSIDETVQRINDEKFDVIGFGAVSRRIYALYELLERTVPFDNPGWKIVGGPHASLYADQLLKKGADAVFVGQLADSDLYEWCKKPRKGIIKCKADINELSHPRRAIIENYEDYFYNGKIFFETKKRMHMFTSMGCPNRCNFCSVQNNYGIQYKHPRLVLAEMYHLESLGAESIHIMDDNFNVSPKHVNGICEYMELSGWDMEWSIRGQVKFDLSLVPRMRKNGMNRVHVGIEALNDESLKWYGKRHNVSDIEKFCEVMKDNDVEVLAYLIIGSPFDTESYLKDLPEKMSKLGVRYPFVNVLFPMPNTPYYESLVKDGTYKKDHWAEYMENPSPNYCLPSPYGNKKKESLIKYADSIMKEFVT